MASGVIQDWLAFFVARDGIGNHGGIVTLIVGYRIAEAIGLDLVVNRSFTTPARITAGEIGFAVVIGIKQFGNFRIF